ncbi:MAG: aminopeptidase P family N-terminal domain-containing protein, partial [Planctomycetales bacterium]
MNRHASRRAKLIKLLRKSQLDALLVTEVANVTYLTGFTGDDSYLFLTPKTAVIISDFRYITQLKDECPDLDAEFRGTGSTILDVTGTIAQKTKIGVLGIEGNSINLTTYNQLSSKLPKSVEVTSTTGLVETLREIKDAEEIALTRKAVWCAEKAFEVVRNGLEADQTEREAAFELEHVMRRFGAEGCSFPPIVAVGPRAALPHARPTDQRIGEAPFVLIDWGA